jgi:hypothetical protein
MARLRTVVSVPVAQDASGQSESTTQASKARVMESPTATSESGLRSQMIAGACALAGAPLVWVSDADSQPVSTPVAKRAAAMVRAVATVRADRGRTMVRCLFRLVSLVFLVRCSRIPDSPPSRLPPRSCRVKAWCPQPSGPTLRHPGDAYAR